MTFQANHLQLSSGNKAMMSCSNCKSQSARNLGLIEGYKKGSFFDIFSCTNCGVNYASPLKIDNYIYNSIYKNVERVPGYSRYYKLSESILTEKDPLDFISKSEDCYYAVIEYLKKDIKNNKKVKIIEIGCGQGYLTYALKSAGFNITGIDISQEAIILAKKKYGGNYYCGNLESFIKKTKGKPGYIICTELIEHLENPIHFVKNMLSLVSKGGKLIVTTPNKIDRNKSIWDTDLPPVHLWWFTRKSMVKMAEKIGCKIDFFNFTDYFKNNSVLKDYFLNFAPNKLRTPTFSENYALIKALPKKDIIFYLQKYINHIKPINIYKKIYRFYFKNLKKEIRNDNESTTLCVIFQKR
jgi:2-polyprenyl-3-methyl-5-hydroxy-6-metoxy-1,4-benzoquinol methylase